MCLSRYETLYTDGNADESCNSQDSSTSSDSNTSSGESFKEISSGNIQKKNRKILTKRKETKGKDKNTVIKEMEENSKCKIQTIKERKGSLQSVS